MPLDHLNTLEAFFRNQLRGIYDAEHQQLDFLDDLSGAARAPQLAGVLREHRDETKEQIRRLDEVFEEIDATPSREADEGMQGLFRLTREIAEAEGDHQVRDAALLSSVQRIKHDEMAIYGSLRNLAWRLRHSRAHALMQDSLDEEQRLDEKLNELAELFINVHAVRAGDDDGDDD